MMVKISMLDILDGTICECQTEGGDVFFACFPPDSTEIIYNEVGDFWIQEDPKDPLGAFCEYLYSRQVESIECLNNEIDFDKLCDSALDEIDNWGCKGFDDFKKIEYLRTLLTNKYINQGQFYFKVEKDYELFNNRYSLQVDSNKWQRYEAAKRDVELEKLVFDCEPDVRKKVAEEGFGLDALVFDNDREVRKTAIQQLPEGSSSILSVLVNDWAEQNSDKCAFAPKECDTKGLCIGQRFCINLEKIYKEFGPKLQFGNILVRNKVSYELADLLGECVYLNYEISSIVNISGEVVTISNNESFKPFFFRLTVDELEAGIEPPDLGGHCMVMNRKIQDKIDEIHGIIDKDDDENDNPTPPMLYPR